MVRHAVVNHVHVWKVHSSLTKAVNGNLGNQLAANITHRYEPESLVEAGSCVQSQGLDVNTEPRPGNSANH